MRPEDAAKRDHHDLHASLWAETAIAAPPCPPLRGAVRADVAIVGGGYTGLSAALHAAERGAKAVVLEAKEPGWGASGRNGGQVIAGLKILPDEMDATFGVERGAIVRGLSGNAPDYLFGLIKRHKIECEAIESGWLQPAHGQAGRRKVEARAAQWSKHGVAARLLDRNQVAELVGTDAYAGGWLDPRGGSVQPLSLARGLAKAALAAGATIHGETRIARIERRGGAWALSTADGASVEASNVILATNGYTDDLWPGLRRTIVPVRPFQVASAPLGENVRRTIFPQGHVGSDTKRMLSYYRLDPTGRILMGGRGSVGHGRSAAIHAQLRADVRRFFPHLGELTWEYAWSGWVALTKDSLPHIHELAPGVHAGLGYQGRGVAMAVVFGRELARRALESRVEDGWPLAPMEPLPFHALRKPILHGIRAYYRMRDKLDR